VKQVRDSSDTNLEFESYVAAMCGLTLMMLLVVGAAGYAGISRAFRSAARAESAAYVAPVKRPPMPRS
jgi:hypothetical protein